MKNILSIFALFIALSFLGASEVKAETYLVNLDGSQGCGQYCSQLNSYLATQNTNSNSTTTYNTNNTGGQVNPDASGNYPYQVYTNFPATTNYYKSLAGNSGTPSYNGYNYAQYPYPIYSYFQNPNPSPAPTYTNGQYQSYPTPMYNYYGKSSSTVNYNQQTPTQSQNLNTGFVLTSIR